MRQWLLQGLGGAIDALLAGPDGELRLSAVEAVGSLDEAWRDVVWRPGDEAAPCCGLQCETCEEVTPEKFWCGGNIIVRPFCHRRAQFCQTTESRFYDE